MRAISKELSEKPGIDEFLAWSKSFREKVGKRGSILNPGETWKDLAREGIGGQWLTPKKTRNNVAENFPDSSL